jgi:hypothetical protein
MVRDLPVGLRDASQAVTVRRGHGLASAFNLWALVTCVIMDRALQRG